jgi:hypothetical protein
MEKPIEPVIWQEAALEADAPVPSASADKEKPAAASKKDVPHSGVGMFGLLMACVCTATISTGTSFWLLRDKGNTNIVALDTMRLIDAKAMELSLSGNASRDDAAREGGIFSAKLKAEVDSLGKRGYTVLNGKALLVDGGAIDITADVAKILGVNLAAMTPDYIANASDQKRRRMSQAELEQKIRESTLPAPGPSANPTPAPQSGQD